MNGYTVLCFLLLITVSMSKSTVKESEELGLTRQLRACSVFTCSYDQCKSSGRREAECRAEGCTIALHPVAPIPICIKYKAPSCFPGSAMVTTPTGNVAMETLGIGDSVLTVLANTEVGFTKVVGIADRRPEQEARFLSITAVNQAGHTHTVKLTATHNIYVKTQYEEYAARFAKDVLIGDVLKTQTDNGTAVNEAIVTYVRLHKEIGAYAPLTETGTMLVDGTLVSCYASFNDYLAHLVTAPIRWFPWLFAGEKPLDGTLPYVATIKYLARSLVAPIVSLN